MIVVALAVAALDQYCKKEICKKLPTGSFKEIKKDRVYLANIKNKGLAFGALSNNRKATLTITAISSCIIGLLIAGSHKNNKGSLYKFALALIAGGGLSNVYDRLVKGEVTDYIYIKYRKAPIFNIADVGIFFGFILSIISEIFND